MPQPALLVSPAPPPQAGAAMTLLDLVREVALSASSDVEIVEVVKDLINSGKVTLVGNFRGADVKVA